MEGLGQALRIIDLIYKEKINGLVLKSENNSCLKENALYARIQDTYRKTVPLVIIFALDP